MFQEVEGDLFDPKWGFDAIGHGVNCEGVMGSGIAPRFRALSEPMYQAYRERCKTASLEAGDIFAWAPGLDSKYDYIYNMATQIFQGPNAAYVYVVLALMNMRDHARDRGVKHIGIPLIGCGIGGLEWYRVKYLCESVFEGEENITLTAVHFVPKGV